MGKIFDALEKANKLSNNTSRAIQRKTKDIKGEVSKAPQKAIGNIVPFANPKECTTDNKGLNQNLIAFHEPHSVEAEIFKGLRTNLLFPSDSKPPRSIMVTSATSGDGKTFVSANLAVSIAQGVDDHVLLIDTDIRNPSIDKMFGMEGVKGLSEYLAKGSNVAENLVKTMVNKLTILPAGQISHNPTELLTTKKMKMLLNEVVTRYDDRFIIIDSAPPSVAPEAGAITKYVDGIIVVIKAGKTPKKEVMEVIERLGKEKILGVVFNYSDMSAKKYYGYGKSYSYK